MLPLLNHFPIVPYIVKKFLQELLLIRANFCFNVTPEFFLKHKRISYLFWQGWHWDIEDKKYARLNVIYRIIRTVITIGKRFSNRQRIKHKSMHVEKHTKYEKQISSKIPRNSLFQDHIVDLSLENFGSCQRRRRFDWIKGISYVARRKYPSKFLP